MNYKFKSLFIASILALATTHSFAQTAPAVGTTLGDLQSATTFDQAGMDTAIRDSVGELSLNYAGALTGGVPTLTKSAAVILQVSDTSFAFIEQVAILATDLNYAVIDQTAADNNAYILQTGSQNYASIVQGGIAPSVAYISQNGATNRAIINQK